ncbi:hypothetical protein [Acetivibrio cellulolyticus]|uniref:hypothetical protein n=1 Tax=Acetivibrio cellulolyticus TaxID=35830 RepID=UPI0001E2F562|nr:hypothetical protein [Acetivibrio cellulolyticus]
MNYISTVIIVVVVSVLMKYLLASSKKQPIINEEGTIILKMNKAYAIIGYIGIAFTAIIGIIASLGTVKSNQDLFIVIGLVLLFLGLSVPLVLVAKRVKIEANEEKITYIGITGKQKVIMWNDIKKVGFSKSMLELALITDKTKIKVHMHYIGFPTLIELMKSKVEYSLCKDAIYSIETVSNRF